MDWLATAQDVVSMLSGSGNGWAGQLQAASWKDVPFHVDTSDITAGDNVVLREYPFQDLPTVFRMGEGAEEIKFSAYVIGKDYQAQRDALRQALTGEGVLIHPTSGAVRCWVNGKYTVREAPTTEGGMARFDLTFVRAEPRRYPRAVTNTADSLLSAALEMAKSAMDLFAAVWSLRGQQGWVVQRLLDRFGGGLGEVWRFLSPLLAGGGDWAAGVSGQWQMLGGNLETLANTPQALAAAVGELMAVPADLEALFESGAAKQDTWLTAYEWVFDLPSRIPQRDFETVRQPDSSTGMMGLAMYGEGNAGSLLTDSAVRQELGRIGDAGDLFLQCLGTAALAQVCAAAQWEDTTAALDMRRRLHAHCLALLQQANMAPAELPGSDWYTACMRMHTAILDDFAARSNISQQHTTVTLQTWTPVWKLSYDLYGSADYADEILAANPVIKHPLLVPPGKPLRVVKR